MPIRHVGEKDFNYDVIINDVLKKKVGMTETGKPIYRDVLTLNYYKFEYNTRGFIISASAVDKSKDWDWYGQISRACFDHDLTMGCYSFVKGVDTDPVFNQAEYERILVQQEEERKKREKEEQRIPAQVTYTAIMTDTELPPDELLGSPNELSPFAQKVKTWYDMGLWTADMVYQMVEKGKITEEEYREIVMKNN